MALREKCRRGRREPPFGLQSLAAKKAYHRSGLFQLLWQKGLYVAQDEPSFFNWLIGLFTAIATLLAGRSFVAHDRLDGKLEKIREELAPRIQKLEQTMLTREELRDNLHDFMLTLQRQEDRFDDRLAELKTDLKAVLDKLDRHFEEERERVNGRK